MHEPLGGLLGLPERQVAQRVGHDEVAVWGESDKYEITYRDVAYHCLQSST